MNLVDALPIHLIGLLLLAALVLASTVGARLRARGGDTGHDNDGYILSADLGLLALLIGFTFSLALSRHDVRRDLVPQEANAIGTTWLRAQLAPDPFRSELRCFSRAKEKNQTADERRCSGTRPSARVGSSVYGVTMRDQSAGIVSARLQVPVPAMTERERLDLIEYSRND